jgi:hypothetical protein
MGPLTNAILRPIPWDYQPLVPTGVYRYGSRPRGIGEWQSSWGSQICSVTLFSGTARYVRACRFDCPGPI